MEIGYKQAIRITIREKSGRPIAVLTDSKIMAGNGYEVEIERPEVDYATLEDIEKIDSPILLLQSFCYHLRKQVSLDDVAGFHRSLAGIVHALLNIPDGFDHLIGRIGDCYSKLIYVILLCFGGYLFSVTGKKIAR